MEKKKRGDLSRREFCSLAAGAVAGTMLPPGVVKAATILGDDMRLNDIRKNEDIFSYIRRRSGAFDAALYRRLVGSANDFKEGDRIVGVAAADDLARQNARSLLAHTRIGELSAYPLIEDPLYTAIIHAAPQAAQDRVANLTLGELRRFVLTHEEPEILPLLEGLTSDVIGCLVKLMNEDDLIAVGQKIFPALPGTMLGARGYMGARIQPNSPTDNPEDVFWQVMSAFSFAVGDVVLGTNPVSSEPESVAKLETVLLDIRRTFAIEEIVPHSVLSHIDIQAAVEKKTPGSTGIWFQSLAGSTAANAVFDLTLEKLLDHAARRTGKYGLYFETGQGSEFTNGQGQGADMVILESRKYGLARLLKLKTVEAQLRAGRPAAPWVHVNDVAGFIGPEVFRSREQLVRCCLEDIAMGKLHGLTIGLDICSTLHMDVSLDDLDWCMDRIMPANPAYLMALPTKMDPMLGYLTTAYQDHVRLRHKFGFKVNNAMWQFFQRLGVIDREGNITAHFGQPLWVWQQYCRAKGDRRSDAAIAVEGRRQMAAVRRRGVPIAEGFGKNPWDLAPELDREIRAVYAEAKKCIWADIPAGFKIPSAVRLATTSQDRTDYILHPQTGEVLDPASLGALKLLGKKRAAAGLVQIVISDGLNALSITDEGNLSPYLESLRTELARIGLPTSAELLVVKNGRVRAGYRIGEALFGGLSDKKAHRGIVHIIGERPGSMHHTFSAYLTAPAVELWGEPGKADHNITRVVSGIAATASDPKAAAAASAKIIRELFAADR